MTEPQKRETLTFQTEARQLLQLMIHSLYSNKEIFVRELISNASDACDKLRFEALTNKNLLSDPSDLEIQVKIDSTDRTITFSDNGIGMSRQEVIEQIGTIAKSGTREFMNKLTGDQAADAKLIGQFGVGFYSAFIVADGVELITRRAGLSEAEGVHWESKGEGDYTLDSMLKTSRGTNVILHLRKDENDLLSSSTLRDIIQKYSDHITIPILMNKEHDPSSANSEKKVPKTSEPEKINQASALWARPKTEITENQYFEFYKHVAHDFLDPLAYTHSRVEGRQEYTLLFYIPQQAPLDLWNKEEQQGIKLYVRRVFIMDGADQLLPNYLRFVRGLIDSNDLPLNVSRELLQNSRDVELIKNASTKRILGLLEDLSTKKLDGYNVFWKEFGRVMKEGVGEDIVNKDRIANLLRFASTHTDTEEQSVSLADYVQRMPSGQEKIYYITADGFSAAYNSPHLEVFRKQNIEVLLLHDRVDEWLVAHLPSFGDKQLQSVTKGDLDLGSIDGTNTKKKTDATEEAHYTPMLSRIQAALGDKAKTVRLTDRLTESPACLVTEQDGISSNLERVLQAAGQNVPAAALILELNPSHPIVKALKDEKDDSHFSDWAHILFDQAMLAEGGHLNDPAAFVKKLNDLILKLSGEQKSQIWTPGS